METFTAQEVTLAAPAKINTSLYVGAAREDGYHPITSIMVPLALSDSLVLNFTPGDRQLSCTCRVNGCEQLSGQPNLVTQLAHCFGQVRDLRGHLDVSLKKNIPLKAGLGGGSSDGAVVLNWLNNQTKHPWDLPTLCRWAAQYSADTPFFLYGKEALVEGMGEQVTPLSTATNGPRYLILAKPPADYSTKQIYQQFDKNPAHQASWPQTAEEHKIGHNDLLEPALKFCPAIKTALTDLQLALAKSYQKYTTVSLSGSGSTCYALLNTDLAGAKQAFNALERRPKWFYALTSLQ